MGEAMAGTEHYKCRAYGHAWDWYSPVGPQRNTYNNNMVYLRCLRCGTARHDAYDLSGGLANRRYHYAEGYQAKRDDKPTTEQLRLWGLRKYRGRQPALS